jgi:hypothetical protein
MGNLVLFNKLFGDIQRDGHTPNETIGQSAILDNSVCGQLSSPLNKPIVLRLRHETFQGGETTVEYQFQITKLPFIQCDARQRFRFSEQRFALRFVSCNQIFQLAAMRCILFRGRLRRVVERGGVSATFAVAFCLCHFLMRWINQGLQDDCVLKCKVGNRNDVIVKNCPVCYILKTPVNHLKKPFTRSTFTREPHKR